MGSSAVRIACVAFGVLVLILLTVCCAVPNWITMSITYFGKEIQGQLGLWKSCATTSGEQVCLEYSLGSDLRGVRALTVISCLITYVGFTLLLLLSFCSNCIPFLQNEDNKPKIRLGVGVGLLLAGLLVIIAVSWFPSVIETGGSTDTNRGAGIYVGYVAGVLQLLGGGLLCFYHKKAIP